MPHLGTSASADAWFGRCASRNRHRRNSLQPQTHPQWARRNQTDGSASKRLIKRNHKTPNSEFQKRMGEYPTPVSSTELSLVTTSRLPPLPELDGVAGMAAQAASGMKQSSAECKQWGRPSAARPGDGLYRGGGGGVFLTRWRPDPGQPGRLRLRTSPDVSAWRAGRRWLPSPA
jgi:hypothetical protein